MELAQYEHYCYTCRKKFSTYSAYEGWIYRREEGKKKMFFCSYNCMRKYDRKRARKSKYGVKKVM